MDGERSAAAPLVVFTSRPNSHPFQERHVHCQDPVKIGRSVARLHPAPTNAIFDCKVLSRNHALLWSEDNKFYLQDTKSSNGTFVNNQRLSKGSEESDPHEIFSGDIIQFGVDVMENSKRVTHGCIMASITLYLADGTEAKPRFSSGTPTSSHPISAVHSQEMYQLSQYLQEALHREQVLQEKMTHLQSMLHSTNDSCESSWHALIKEDRLLSKLEVLQNQLSVFSKNQTEGSIQNQILNMEEERLHYEQSSKESLRKVLEEKIAAIQELSDVERSLANTENECRHLKELHQQSQQQFSELTEKYEEKFIEHAELSKQLQEAETRREADMADFEAAKEVIEAKLEAALADKDSLEAKLSHLQNLQSSKPEEPSSNGDGEDTRINGEHLEEVGQGEEPPLEHANSLDSLRLEIEKSQVQIEDYQNLMNKAKQSLSERDEEIQTLNQSVEQAQLEIVEYVTKVATLEEKLKLASESSTVRVEESTEHLQERIEELSKSHEEVVQKLKGELETMHLAQSGAAGGESAAMAHQVKDLQDKLELAQTDTESLKEQIQQIQDKLSNEQKLHQQRDSDAHRLQDELDQTRKEMENQKSAAVEYQEKAKQLELKLQEMSDLHTAQVVKVEADSASLRQEAITNKKECDALREECSTLRSRIQSIEEELHRLQQDNSKLDDDVTKTKSHNDELSNEIAELQKSYSELKLLKESLETSESSIKGNLTDAQKEAQMFKDQLETEKSEREALLTKYGQSVEELRLSKEQVEQTQALHSTAQQQLEELRQQLATAADNYSKLADTSNSISLSSRIPLMVLVIAVVLALYPVISRVTSSGS